MTSDRTTKNPKHMTPGFLLLLFCYFSLHIVLRVVVSDSLDYDEAEQALLGQWLLAGYTEQPPLYTWVQHFLFELFGKNVFAVSLWKNLLLFLTYVCVFFGAREILKCPRKAILATCSLLLIPQICWESQRDMTHTTLVVFAAAATLLQTMRCVKNQHLINYCILGLLLSIGILAKVNFALFTSILFLTLALFPEGRKVIFSKKMLVTLMIIIALTGSYFLWMANNQDIVFSATHKFKQATTNAYLKGTGSLIANSFLFLTPLWLVYLLIFPKGFGKSQIQDPDFHNRFIRNYILTLFLVLLAVVLLFKVTYVKDRWLQPLLFAAPIFFFSRMDSAGISARQFKFFLRTVAVAAIGVFMAFTIRTVGASYIHKFCRLNYPFSVMAENIRESGFTGGIILSDNRFIAGNMHFQFPGSTAIIPEYRFEDIIHGSDHSSAIVLWKADYAQVIPEKLATFIEKTYGVRATDFPVSYYENPYKYARTETVRLAVMQIPISKAE